SVVGLRLRSSTSINGAAWRPAISAGARSRAQGGAYINAGSISSRCIGELMIASRAFKLRCHKLNGPIPPTIAAAVLALDRWVSFGLLETVGIVLAFRRSGYSLSVACWRARWENWTSMQPAEP